MLLRWATKTHSGLFSFRWETVRAKEFHILRKKKKKCKRDVHMQYCTSHTVCLLSYNFSQILSFCGIILRSNKISLVVSCSVDLHNQVVQRLDVTDLAQAFSSGWTEIKVKNQSSWSKNWKNTPACRVERLKILEKWINKEHHKWLWE